MKKDSLRRTEYTTINMLYPSNGEGEYLSYSPVYAMNKRPGKCDHFASSS